MEFNIEKATSDDIPVLVDIINISFLELNGQEGWTSMAAKIEGPRITTKTLKSDMDNPESAMLKCVHSKTGEIVGCVFVERFEKDSIYSGVLSVLPTAQGKGVGKLLTDAADELGIEWGCKSNKISVASGRDSLFEFYERRGFRKTGRLYPIPDESQRDWKVKSDFELLEMEKILI